MDWPVRQPFLAILHNELGSVQLILIQSTLIIHSFRHLPRSNFHYIITFQAMSSTPAADSLNAASYFDLGVCSSRLPSSPRHSTLSLRKKPATPGTPPLHSSPRNFGSAFDAAFTRASMTNTRSQPRARPSLRIAEMPASLLSPPMDRFDSASTSGDSDVTITNRLVGLGPLSQIRGWLSSRHEFACPNRNLFQGQQKSSTNPLPWSSGQCAFP